MELQNTVKEALNALYHHPDDTVRMQADRWLQDFQRTLDAWQVVTDCIQSSSVVTGLDSFGFQFCVVVVFVFFFWIHYRGKRIALVCRSVLIIAGW